MCRYHLISQRNNTIDVIKARNLFPSTEILLEFSPDPEDFIQVHFQCESSSLDSYMNTYIGMGGGWFPKLVWPKHNKINQQVKVGVANNDKRGQYWCGNGYTCHTAFSTHVYRYSRYLCEPTLIAMFHIIGRFIRALGKLESGMN